METAGKVYLASCEFGEDAAQKAYKDALEENDLSPDVRATIENQKATLREAHDKIKMMRDTAACSLAIHFSGINKHRTILSASFYL